MQYSHTRAYYSQIKNYAHSRDEFQRHFTEWKKQDSEGYKLYDSTYMTL